MRIKGTRKWYHVVSTPNLTYYALNASRGSKANEDMGILPVYSGTAIDQIKKREKKGANEGPKSVRKTAKVSKRSSSLHA